MSSAYIVVLKEDTSDAALEAFAQNATSIAGVGANIRLLKIIHGFATTLTAEAKATLEAKPEVAVRVFGCLAGQRGGGI